MHGNVEKSCDLSLESLGLEYIDLLLLHCTISRKKWRLIIGPIAFKAKEDGVTVATHSDGKVSNLKECN